MKCRPGVTTRTFCLDCHVQGEITGYSSPMISMKCPACGKEWRTLSAICQRCKTPSGSPYYSDDCPNCGGKDVA